MKISLKEYFISLSSLLDFLEVELHKRPTNHCKRVSYLSLVIGQELGLNHSQLIYLGALSLLHDLGASKAILIQKMEKQKFPDIEVLPDHCKAGAELIRRIPFLADYKDVILYHHERFDGKGYYKKSEGIPLFSRIITMADRMDMELANKGTSVDSLKNLIQRESGRSFAPQTAAAAIKVLSDQTIPDSLLDEHVTENLQALFPDISLDIDDREMLDMAAAFSTIVDAKSPFTKNHSSALAVKVELLCRYYNFEESKVIRMVIAAHLHDIGKLMVPNRILEKDGKLTTEEFSIIKQHTFYTRQALSQIHGCEDITDWASDHHEKLNGLGYPLGKSSDEMPFESRMMACLDIFQALTEARPYKEGFSLEKTLSIMDECVHRGEIDGKIVDDIKVVFNSGALLNDQSRSLYALSETLLSVTDEINP